MKTTARSAVLVIVVGAVAMAVPAGAYQRPGVTDRVSVGANGAQANGASPDATTTSVGIAMTPNGRYVAFASSATNLVPGYGGAHSAVYVRDRVARTTRIASVPSKGDPALSNNPVCTSAESPAISNDGRFVAFVGACQLTTGGTPLTVGKDVFVHDMKLGTTARVSVSSLGVAANAFSMSPAISRDGRLVAFTSAANNLVSDSTCLTDGLGKCFTSQVYVRDIQKNTTKLVSVSSTGVAANGASQDPSISADGRYVTFASQGNNLASNDQNICTGYIPSCPDVFIHDLRTGKTELISVGINGLTGPNRSDTIGVAITQGISSGDRYVAFRSSASGLVPSDPAVYTGIYVRDRKLNRTERVAAESSGVPLNLGEGHWAMSANGRYVVFDDLPAWFAHCSSGHSPGSVLGIHDQLTGATEVLGRVDFDGKQDDCSTQYGTDAPQVSLDGRYVSFVSDGARLVRGDTNGANDVFVQDRGTTIGVGGLAASGKLAVAGVEDFRATGVALADDGTSDVDGSLTSMGANLIGASLAYRPATQDVFVRLPVARMPRFEIANPALVYGLDLTVGSAAYEVRVAKVGLDASFGLFRRDFAGRWVHVADLHGGYGTTGQEVVFPLPLTDIGAQRGGEISSVRAFTGLGSYLAGVLHPIDDLAVGEATR